MTKVAIITCHDVYNHGASLQAYALSHYVSSLGCDVRIIDYKPPYLSRHYSLTAVNNPKWDYPILRYVYLLAKLPQRLANLKNKRRFDEFTKRMLPLTRRYRSIDELRSEPPQADIYIAGSDQIWNPIFPNGRDSAFFLDFGPKQTARISYAASFAIPEIPSEEISGMTRRLKLLDVISIRERSGLSVLQSMGLNGTYVCDPVWLLDRNQWLNIANGAQLPQLPSRYLLAYGMGPVQDIAERVADEARTQGLPVISVGDYIRDTLFLPDIGPKEFLALIKNAETIVTNSYHGLIFASIFGTRYIPMMRNDLPNERLNDFLATSDAQRAELIDLSRQYLISHLKFSKSAL
ncbi:MAG: polysaccharide pyruvyl transferase family protein [Duncaniella sp.]|nr:polysaccharide pyruvyl transferase family protein [Duncaniella sp.]